jgi:hypothetical protein
MPAAFFEHLGYHQVAQREAEALFFKSTNGSEEPTFLPIRHQATTLEDKIAIDYFHCPQCPMSGWALAGLEKKVKTYPDQVHMQVHPTGERSALERIGIAQAVYIDGLRIRSFPPNPDSLASELEARISAKGGVAD